MKVILQQGTDEWKAWREGGIGGSDIATVMGVNKYKTAHQLWLEKTGQLQPEDLSQNPIVQKGVRLEPEARSMAATYLDTEFEPACFIHPEHSFLRYSSDGWNDTWSHTIEIKCPMIKTHDMALNDQIPEHYYYQVQYGMLVSGATRAHFVSYRPESSIQLAVIPVEANKELQQKMILAAKEFWECVVNKTPLKGTTIQNELLTEVENLVKIKDQIKSLEEVKESIEKALQAKMQTEKVMTGDYTLAWSERKGSVDYAKVPELNGVDLEPYRKPSSRVFSIRKGK